MFDKKIIKQSIAFAVCAILYITLIVTLLDWAGKTFVSEDKILLQPIGFLLLLVVSAATMGMLIFGKPLMLYMDGKKREALGMVISTIVSLATCTILVFTTLAFLMHK